MVRSRLVIANIDGRNPNVFYELGIAHAIDKPTIIISKSVPDIEIDIKSKYLLLYKNEQDLKEQIRKNLTKILVKE